MKILSIGRSHDANFCIYDSESDLFRYFKLERMVNCKHACFGRHVIGHINKEMAANGFIPDAVVIYGAGECYKALFGETFGSDFLDDQMFRTPFVDSDFPNAKRYWIDHHYAHALSAWPLGRFEYGVAVDGRGPTHNSTMIYKDVFEPEKASVVYENKEKCSSSSFGEVFGSLGHIMGVQGQHIDMAGKVMGAHAYGTPDDLTDIDLKGYRERIDKVLWPFHKYKGDKRFGNQEFIDMIATAHKLWEAVLEDLILEFVPCDSTVSLSGGSAQNTVLNERLLRYYPKMEFVPHCYDGGLSVGGIALLCLLHDVPLPSLCGFPYWQKDEVTDSPTPETIKAVASELQEGKIVGWHQGRGEIGPRALGNRSILMHPAIPEGKSILNDKVKHREHWRPYAASVLEEHASEWFETDTPSPYMMRAIRTRENKRHVIPAVVHEDGTCRIQTVNRSQNPAFYDLISEFYKLTGIPMLLNTSLNAGGKPISGHPDWSLEILKNSEMDMICIGNKVTYSD
jgi:carbamoyltransferase